MILVVPEDQNANANEGSKYYAHVVPHENKASTGKWTEGHPFYIMTNDLTSLHQNSKTLC
jgi:hypothetical protein